MINKRVRNAVLGCNLKIDRIISVRFQGKPFSITGIQVYVPTSNAEEAQRFYEDLQDLLELTPPKICPFHYRGLECKYRMSRNSWSNRQIWPWSTEWSKAGLIEFCQENALVIANTLFQQHKRRLYSWTSPDGQHWNQIDYILCSQGWNQEYWSSLPFSSAVDHIYVVDIVK